MAELIRDGAEGLILDLRWCPGGYVVPTTRITGDLLPPGKLIAKNEGRIAPRNTPETYLSAPPPGTEDWQRLPLVVLVGPETIGGSELIAAALQDHGRGTIVGQRTFGKANIMDLIDTAFPSVGYRVTTWYSLRPNGKHRHRFPDSKPTDDWGVRPDRGFEVPITPDFSARLRGDAERLAIRPAGSTAAIALDDPQADPQRMVALKLLKEKIRSADREQHSSKRIE
jgi:carboxyl-terminal processing protease